MHPSFKALRLPVIAAPLFIISTPRLVIAQCKAGIVGSFPALNARPAHVLDEWLTRIKAELAAFRSANPGRKTAPFAVNQIVHASNDRLLHDVDVCAKHEVPIVITSLRAPREVVERVHAYGGIVLHDVTTIRCLIAPDEAKNRALTCAVSADEPDVFTGVHLQSSAAQDILNAVGFINV